MKPVEEDKKVSRIQEIVYETKVREVMKKDVVTVTPQTRMSDLREIFRVKRISGTPVVKEDKLVGVISLEDFIKWLAEREDDCPIERKMIRQVEAVYADEPLIHAVAKFETSGFGRFPVIERGSGRLVGIITKGDVIEGLLGKLEVDYQQEEIHRYRASHIFEDLLAVRKRIQLEYDVAGQDFSRGGEGAGQLKLTLRRLGLNPLIIRRVAVATYEAEMNLVVFTDGGKITAEVRPDQIQIDVEDSGPGIEDIERARQPGYSTAPDWVRELGFGAGMGLSNIEKCADSMDIASTVGKGTHVRFSVAMKEGNEAGRNN